ncbi:MAG: glycosyltransferase family 2 protein [Mucilaginibacter sp.]
MAGISFFIPAYNCGATLEEAVRSIRKTNFNTDDELIIVNDFSRDNTEEIINKLKKEYPDIIHICHTQNKGGGAARNTAIENSKNDLLFCLDADNILEANSISPLKRELINKHADVASFMEMRYFNTANHNDIQYIWRFLRNTSLADFMADHKNPGSSGNYLFTKKSWLRAGGYPEFAGALDTWGFCFRQLATGSKLVALKGSYYFHRYGDNSYYIRDMQSQNMSSVAMKIILPSINLFDQDDIAYMTNEKTSLTWFDELDKHPIKLAGQPIGSKSLHINMNRRFSVRRLMHKASYRLKKIFSR